MRRCLYAVFAILAQCKDPSPARVDPVEATAPSATATASTTSVAPTSTAEVVAPIGDAGLAGCAVAMPPTKLARRGPFTAVSRMGFVDFYVQDGGAPALAGSVRVEARAAATASSAPPVAGADGRGGTPTCAASGIRVFCMNSTGKSAGFALASSARSRRRSSRGRDPERTSPPRTSAPTISSRTFAIARRAKAT